MNHFIAIVVTAFFSSALYAQAPFNAKDTIKTVFENEKMKVTKYVSSPGTDVCGSGLHSHQAHLNILLTEANVSVTSAGKTQNVTLPEGSVFWSEPDTHIAVNSGKKEMRLYIVELKE